MEHNNTINSTFAMELREITDNDLDALLHFDSPPLTVRYSEQQRMDEDNDGHTNCSLSLLQFNREPLPSQMSAHVADVCNFPDDLDFTLNFSQNISQPSVSIKSLYTDSVHLVDNTSAINEVLNEGATNNDENVCASTSISTDLGNTGGALTIKTPSCRSPDSLDEIIKKELLDQSVIEDFCNDVEFTAFENFNLDQAPIGNVSCAKGSNLKRNCQTQICIAKCDPTKQIYASCPEQIHIGKSPSLPSTITGGGNNQMSLPSTPSNIQINAIDYTIHTEHHSSLDKSRRNSVHLKNACTSALINSIDYNSTADSTMVPASVKQLYTLVHEQYSDFAFVYALSAQLCQERVPMDCYVNLKMGLLLSLASISLHPDRPPVPIMAFGSDTYMANFLLTNIGQLAERFAGPGEDVKPPSNNNYLNCKWLEADPIVLAKGGVYFVGDWSRLKLARADNLFRIVECSKVPIERSTITYQLETAIWSHWRSCKGDAKDQQTFNKVVKIFGILICMDDDEKHEVLLDYILEQSSVNVFESTIDHLSISSDDMRSFLKTISKRTVDLTPEALQLLQKYFVNTRFTRPDKIKIISYTPPFFS
ncbi:uncharacterized protein mei-218 isoform X2 [Eurosta solidaginis]|uniref:uncharacterized protein mei-218 isoform X2 n=1 Tax=Eurosta solidaginis TaxID=178769 RepID=UPI0035312ECE